jgi:stearoyl-CoA desaturase (Delta-9 desaturase)
MQTTTQPTRPAASENGSPREDIQPASHETLDRVITGMVTLIPFLMVGFAAWRVWNTLLNWHDLVVFAIVYVLTGLGVTVGFHRHLTHRSFEAGRAVRGTLAALGSAAIEAPLV